MYDIYLLEWDVSSGRQAIAYEDDQEAREHLNRLQDRNTPGRVLRTIKVLKKGNPDA